MSFLKRLLPPLLSFGLLSAIIYSVPPPKSWAEASIFQILILFIPMLVFFTSVTDLFFNYLPKSFSVSLGLMFLVVLKSIGDLNPVTFVLVIVASLLLSTAFKKGRSIRLPKRRSRSKLTH